MKNKRGQITIFIIVAVVIVALAVLFYLLAPKIGISPLQRTSQNPEDFFRTCIRDDLQENINKISQQGGSMNPQLYFTFDDVKIGYLCYTGQYYQTCSIQQPLLGPHIEREIKESIEAQVDSCFNALKTSFEGKGYGVTINPGTTYVELLPKLVVNRFNYTVTLAKDGVEKHDRFDVIVNNNLYELIGIASSILRWETTYGDADPTIYMSYYPNIRVNKNLRDDGTTLYTITDKTTGDSFQFASRSVAFPPGY